MENIKNTREELLLMFYDELYVNICSRNPGYRNPYSYQRRVLAEPGCIRAYSNPKGELVVEDSVIQEFLDKNKVFYFREKSFIFAESKNAKRTYYVNPQFINDTGKYVKADIRVKLYVELFPELKFISGKRDVLRTGLLDSSILLAALPTRTYFINKALDEL